MFFNPLIQIKANLFESYAFRIMSKYYLRLHLDYCYAEEKYNDCDSGDGVGV